MSVSVFTSEHTLLLRSASNNRLTARLLLTHTLARTRLTRSQLSALYRSSNCSPTFSILPHLRDPSTSFGHTSRSFRYSGRKTSPSFSYVTERVEGIMKRAREQQEGKDYHSAVFPSHPVPRLAGHLICNGQRSSEISCDKETISFVACASCAMQSAG
jgi:hypothetical protein